VESFPIGSGITNSIFVTQPITGCAGHTYTLSGYGATYLTGPGTGTCYAVLCVGTQCNPNSILLGSAYTPLSLQFTATGSTSILGVQTYCVGVTKNAAAVYLDSFTIT